MKNDINQIIASELSGQASEEEINALRKWISAKKKNRTEYNLIRLHWLQGQEEINISKKRVFNQLSKKMSQSESTKTRYIDGHDLALWTTWWKIAAVLVLASILSFLYYKNVEQTNQTIVRNIEVVKSNPKGQKSNFMLSDGTLVKLNSDSRLTFLDNLDSNTRDVYLEGEAFFDVAKDSLRPFTVHCGQTSTTALGTSFNVRAYPDEADLRVALLTGVVRVESSKKPNGASQEAILYPGQMASLTISTGNLETLQFDEDQELAWTEQTLHFLNSGLKSMVPELERWYGVQIHLNNKEGITTHFTGKFKDKSLEYVLNVLSNNQKDFSFSINGKNVTITKN